MFWLVADHLGTPRTVVDLTGSLANIKRHDYLPFGEELVAPLGGRSPAQGYPTGNSDGVRQQFTSEERDPETGLDYFGARYYAGTHGRFTSVDPFIGSARRQTPPAWNRYSYALNNPLAYIDPTGEGWVRGRHNEVFWDPEVSTQGEVTKKLVGVSVQVRFQFGLGKQGAGSDYEGPCSTCGSCIPCQTGKNLIEGCEALWSECDFRSPRQVGRITFSSQSAGQVEMMLEEFLKNSKLGSLRLGLSRSDVRRLLGEPPDRSEESWKNEIWKYYGLEVAFRRDSLSFIGLYFEDGEVVLPQALVETGKITIENDRVEDVEEFLRAKHIDFTVDDDLTFDDCRVLRVTESHVGIGFVESHLRSMQLISRDSPNT